ncbi:hypothetical protein BB560_003617 [Smittium megazygosporum]|uniref:Uncharacterized protein n=1 Tax=Smittium megazygosporum TaxID=133381 RepID=A0A2T9ZBG5_9FUNG|nr:hypothetical protein BB560_003617 [Smittium megazygosporum]
MGKITCANVLSDLYAIGVTECDNMLMLLGVSEAIEPEIKNKVVQLIMKGFHDSASLAGTIVTGGQTIRNPWLLLGGVASSVSKETEILRPVNASVGDVLVLTKPLGTRPAVNAHVNFYYGQSSERRDQLSNILSESQILDCYNAAIRSMCRLNKQAATLMKKHDAHAATDVTGFGILGHANQLAENQLNKIRFRIHSLPLLQHSFEIDTLFDYGLVRGTSAETSGGLLIAMTHNDAINFIEELSKSNDPEQAFIVGTVEADIDSQQSPLNTQLQSNNYAFIDKDVKIISVPCKDV